MIKLSDVKVRSHYGTRVRPARAAIRAGARAKHRGASLQAQRADDSAVAEAVAARGRRGVAPLAPLQSSEPCYGFGAPQPFAGQTGRLGSSSKYPSDTIQAVALTLAC